MAHEGIPTPKEAGELNESEARSLDILVDQISKGLKAGTRMFNPDMILADVLQQPLEDTPTPVKLKDSLISKFGDGWNVDYRYNQHDGNLLTFTKKE